MFGIAKGSLLTISVSIERPGINILQITRTDDGVTLTYLLNKTIMKAEHISFVDEPSLMGIVRSTVTGDVWDLDTLIALADKAEAPEIEPEPWKWNGVWQPDTAPDFRNLPEAYQAAV